jgi:hypothetical protein
MAAIWRMHDYSSPSTIDTINAVADVIYTSHERPLWSVLSGSSSSADAREDGDCQKTPTAPNPSLAEVTVATLIAVAQGPTSAVEFTIALDRIPFHHWPRWPEPWSSFMVNDGAGFGYSPRPHWVWTRVDADRSRTSTERVPEAAMRP